MIHQIVLLVLLFAYITYADISADAGSSTKIEGKAVKRETLGYITPWNAKGYDYAIDFVDKLDMVAPVWYTIKVVSENDKIKLKLEGKHNVDERWLESVSHIKVLPRFHIQITEASHFEKIANNKQMQTAIYNMMMKEINRHNFAGVVFEADAYGFLTKHTKWNQFIIDMCEQMHKLETPKLFVMPIRPVWPATNPNAFNVQDFGLLIKHVDRFSLMTYDFSHANPGPNAPIRWVENSILTFFSSINNKYKYKMLMGLNFYGKYFKTGRDEPEAIVADQYDELLSVTKIKAQWDERAAEHILSFGQKNEEGQTVEHWVFYPTEESIEARLELADKLGVGIAIWELGQGRVDFMEML